MKTAMLPVVLLLPVLLGACAFSIGSSRKDVHYVSTPDANPEDYRVTGGWIEVIHVPAGHPHRDRAEREFRHGMNADTSDEAADHMRASIEACPTAAALNNMGCLLEARGINDGAEGWYRAALALDPGHESIRRNLDRVQ